MKPILYKFSLVIFCFLLASCASAQTSQSLSSTKTEYSNFLELSEPYYTLSFPKKPKLKKEDAEKREQTARETIDASCSKPMHEKLNKSVLTIKLEAKSGNTKAINKLTDITKGIYKEFKTCLKAQYKTSTPVLIITPDLRKLTPIKWAQELTQKLNKYIKIELQADKERQESAAKVGKVVVATAVVAGAIIVVAAASRNAGGGPNYSNNRSYRSAYAGNCQYSWQRASDGSICGNRAASVRPGGF